MLIHHLFNCFIPHPFSLVSCLKDSIKIIAAIALTIICLGNYPNSGGTALLIGFLGGKVIQQFLYDRFLADLSNHFFTVTIVTGIVFFSAPIVIKGAISMGFCAWAGSRFKLYLNNHH